MDRLKHSALYARLAAWARKGEGWLKTDIKYLMKGGFWLTSGQVIGSLSTLVLALAFAHLLPKDTYGTYKYILSIGGLLSIFSLSGLSEALLQSVAKGYEGALQQSFKINLLWSIPMALAGAIGAIYYGLHGQMILGLGLLIVGVLSPVFNSATMYGTYLNAKKEFRIATYCWTTLTLSLTAAMVVCIILQANPAVLVLAYFGTNSLVSIIFYWWTLRRYRPDPAKKDPGILRYGGHQSLISVLGIIAGQLDSILVYHYIGAAELAIYSFATAIPDQLKNMFGAFDQLAFPNFTQRSARDIRAGMKSKYVWMFIFSALVVGAYILAAPYIYRWLFPAYTGSIFFSQVFAVSMLNATLFAPTTYLNAKKKVKELYLGNIITYVFQILALVAGMALWGVLGLVIARVAVRWFGSIANAVLFYTGSKKDMIEEDKAAAAGKAATTA